MVDQDKETGDRKHTLICIRQLPFSETTIKVGGLVAALEDSAVTLLTVIPKEADRARAETELASARDLLGDQKVGIKIRRGRAMPEILAESQAHHYDIIVVGSRDAAQLLDGLVGTVTGKVAGKARSSVLVVRGPCLGLRNVLVAIGGHKMKKRVVKAAARLAKASGAAVTVLFVADPVPTMYTGLEALDESLEELLGSDTPVADHLRWAARYLAEQGVGAELKLRRGVVADEIMREARLGRYDLAVVGAPSFTGPLQRLLVEQVTPQIIQRAACSVLVVR
ncbi:MAG: universal stress protein [Candidatus Promineifilaceae bacterium]